MKEAFKKFLKTIGDTWYASGMACMAICTYKDALDENNLLMAILGLVMMILSFCMILNAVEDRYERRIEKLEGRIEYLEKRINAVEEDNHERTR